ncbi:helix-turn-helix domain-containing protein [Labrys okinawensis]|uniref:helix-turn-helix domain-containing protein n=1 Tax=Labrys okinawensis TaxID=346911 RepID=UPI0039BC414D
MKNSNGREAGDRPSKAHGDELGERFWLEKARTHVMRSLRRGSLAVTEIQSDFPTPEPSQSIGYDEAYLVGLMVRDVPDNQLWQDGRAAKQQTLLAGEIAFFDLRRDPINLTRTAHHSLHFYLPRDVLRDIADEAGVRFSGDLCYQFAQGYDDPTIRHLGSALLPILARGEPLDGLFLDHVLYAVATHVVARYGEAGPARILPHGRLAPWQERLAKELMNAHLGSDISLKKLADSCGISVTHFARAFRRSTGASPHQWLQERRIKRAMSLLDGGQMSLADIAIECGFADQSHFTRVFTRHMQMGPGQWRRERATRPLDNPGADGEKAEGRGADGR